MCEIIQVTVSALKAAKSPDVLVAHGLGSCVVIILYDPEVRVGGLSHFLLPDPSMSKDHSNPAKFPQTSLKILLSEMEKLGARRRRVGARLAGGANLFEVSERSNVPPMGMRNIESARNALREEGIVLEGEDVGGNYGRTVEFKLETGEVLVRSHRAGEKVL